MKLTQKTSCIVDLLSRENDFITVYELIEKYPTELKNAGISIDKINSANSSLSSTTLKEIITKSKKQIKDKLVTSYKLVENYKDLVSKEVEK
jgi:arsenate reductase-like glutaredoxin family protein